MAGAKLQGYRRGGSHGPRGYVTPEGEHITYRQYRARVEAAGLVERLDLPALAKRRKQQAQFNEIIKTMSNVRAKALDVQIAIAEERGDEGEAHQLKIERRHVKQTAIRSDLRKQALADLQKFGHQRRDGRFTSEEAAERTKLALIALGRREGIPDWVPVGASDRFRSGKIRPNRIPAKYRPLNTRASKG